MKCSYSKETLALYVEDDLPTREAAQKVRAHVSACFACQQYCEQLQKSQSLIKSRFTCGEREPVSQNTLSQMRRNVMAQVDRAQQSLGWAVRVERFLMFGLRQHRYAAVGFAAVVVVSASLLGQIRRSTPNAGRDEAMFVGANTLLCPPNYHEWVFAGGSSGPGAHKAIAHDNYHNVYISPGAYREYSRSGKFPEGTVMVLESLSADSKQDGLALSVKDSGRFAGGWGFYDLTDGAGKLKPEADALPQTAGCIGCHRDKAATDHVFTQFYAVLRNIRS